MQMIEDADRVRNANRKTERRFNKITARLRFGMRECFLKSRTIA
jgi:hypothetical protein